MQTNIFEIMMPQYKIKNPIRLIELFGGVGSQAKALANIKVKFSHYRLCDFDKYAIASYNAIHGTNFVTSDITKLKGEDLGIVDTNLYDYILAYSYHCQSISIAGKQEGMAKGSKTKSSLLWEVERLLDECKELPQVLLMENVPQVVCDKNINDFWEWQKKLESLGYKNYVELLNAKNYGIPQNRNRCFMVSILGEYYYNFPKPIPLKIRLKDMLEDNVDEKYYLSEKMIRFLIDTTNRNGFIRAKQFRPHNPNESTTAFTVTTRAGSRPCDNFIEVFDFRYDEGARGRTELDLSPTITTAVGTGGISGQPLLKIPEATKKGYALAEEGDGVYINHPHQKRGVVQMVVDNPNELISIRRLTPRECWRLMGFDDEDYEKASKVNSNAQLYKQTGNSIVVNVLEAIFKELL